MRPRCLVTAGGVGGQRGRRVLTATIGVSGDLALE